MRGDMKLSITLLGGMIATATGLMIYYGSEPIFWVIMICVWVGFTVGVVEFFRGNDKRAKKIIAWTLGLAGAYTVGINQASVGAWELGEYSVFPAMLAVLLFVFTQKTSPRFSISGQVKTISNRGDEIAITLVTGEQLRGVGLVAQVGDEVAAYPSRYKKQGHHGYHTVIPSNLRIVQSVSSQVAQTNAHRPHENGDAHQ